jgi:protein-S-isoprenylcysteine O-methyltransferase Ste14
MDLIDPHPTTEAALAALGLGLLVFLLALLLARSRKVAAPQVAEKRTSSSWAGVVIQGLGFFTVGFGPVVIAVDPSRARVLTGTIAVALLVLLTIGLFFAASRAMGRNWSIVARTREDHDLVTWGPFALIRHPIYTALFAWMIAMAIAFGHWRGLILGVPLYWIGTWMRVSKEEALLRAQFGAAYDAYAARVKRFVPGLI